MNFPTNTPADLLAMVKSDEGFRPRHYTDTEGLLTIGIGFCLDRTQMPAPVAEYWCCYLLDQIHSRLQENISVGQTYKQLNQARQFAIQNMCYQMGITGVCKFLNMWASLDIDDYSAAADHALDSVWADQTKARARRIAGVIRSGELIGYNVKKNAGKKK